MSNLKPSTTALNKRVSLSCEALKPGIHFSLAVKALDGVFFQQKAVSYVESLLFSVATFLNYLS